MNRYRVIGIVDCGQGFKTEIIPQTPWFNNYERAKAEKTKLEAEQREGYAKGYGFFIGYYKIEERKLDIVSNYID